MNPESRNTRHSEEIHHCFIEPFSLLEAAKHLQVKPEFGKSWSQLHLIVDEF